MAKVLRTAIARVEIAGKLTFESGDAYMQSIDVNLEEQERASSFSLSLYDPGLKILNLLLTEFQRVGGIMVPKGLLGKTETATEESSDGIASTQTSTQTSPGAIATTANTGSTGKLQGDALARAIVVECKKNNVTQAEQIAYVLATVEVETSMGQILVEYASGDAYEGRSDLGNTQPGDGRRFKGRGPAQTTGRLNYTKWSRLLGVDFVGNPELMADLKYGLPVLVIGMRDGVFTGRSLKTYISGGNVDFVNARRIINGLDKAERVAGYARKWLARLPELGYSASTESRKIATPVPTPETAKQDSSAGSSDILAGLQGAKIDVTTQEINTGEGISVKVSLAFNDSKVYTDHEFFLTSVQGSNSTPNVTQLGGKQIRAIVASGARVVATYQNITLKELANRVGSKVGAEVIVPDIDQARELITAIAQNETDYQLLLRTAKSKGLFVRSEGKKLKLEPLKATDKRVKIPWTAVLPGSNWGDAANDKRSLVTPVVAAIATPSPTTATAPESESSQILAGLSATSTATTKAGVLDLTTPADSSKGVEKGFRGVIQVNALSYPEVLGLLPGTILELTGEASAIIRDYRIDSIRLSWGESATCSIGVYLPVATSGGNIEEPEPGAGATAGTAAKTETIGAGASTPANTPKQGAIAPVQPVNISGRYMLFTPLGTKNSAGAWLYQLQLVEGTTVLETVPCICGFIGYKPVPRSRDRSGSGRPCPAGTFDLPSVQDTGGGSIGTGLGSIFINVSGTSPRSAIGIHSDENANSATAGCLGTIDPSRTAIAKIKGWWTAGAKKLVVRYGDFEG